MTTKTRKRAPHDRRRRARTALKRHRARRAFLGWLVGLIRDVRDARAQARQGHGGVVGATSSRPAPKRATVGTVSASGGLQGGSGRGDGGGRLPDGLASESDPFDLRGGTHDRLRDPFDPAPQQSDAPGTTGQGYPDEPPIDAETEEWADDDSQDTDASDGEDGDQGSPDEGEAA